MKHIILYCFAIVILIVIFNWKSQEIIGQYIYDISNLNSPISSQSEIDSVLNEFNKIDFKNLDTNYLSLTNSNIEPFKQMLQSTSFYIIEGGDKYKRVVNDFRIKDFLPNDSYNRKANVWNSNKIYWLIDKQLLYKTLELQNALAKHQFNPNAFTIVNGHRHPANNKKVGGASKSRHILGQAVDISVGDINQDGKINRTDKNLVLDILENEVIKNSGGIGRYPHSTRAIHYDVRGYKARWDKQ